MSGRCRGSLRGLVLVLAALALAGAAQQADPARVSSALERGRRALQAGLADEAIAAYRELLRLQPDHAEGAFGLGQALVLAGRFDEAIPPLERVRDASGGAAAVQFILGQAYLEARRLSEAAQALAAAAADRPDYPPVLLQLGKLCYSLGRLEPAAERLRAAAAAAPEWDAPQFLLGLVAIDERDWPEADRRLREAARLQPENPETWLVMATALGRQDKPLEALEAVQRAVEAAPDFLPARLALVERLDRVDRVQEQLEHTEAILRVDPDNAVALLGRARRAVLDGAFDAALADLDKLLATAAGARGELGAEARRLRAEVLDKMGRQPEAIQAAHDLVRDAPWFANGQFLLGNLLLRSGAPTGREHLTRFKELSDARLRWKMGDYLAETADLEGAEREYEAALAKAGDDGNALLGLARVRRLQGRAEEAVDLLRRARGGGTPVDEWFRQWILALHATGRRPEALGAWRQALDSGLELTPDVWAVVYDDPLGCDE